MGSAGEIATCGRRPFGAALVVLALLACVAGARGASGGSIGASIDQCANETRGIGDCTGAAWINGNLNENKSLYKGATLSRSALRSPI
jgi:hypothetical protein